MVKTPVRKIRIEIFNQEGKLTVTFEGAVTKEKVIQLLDLVDLMGGISRANVEEGMSAKTKFSRVFGVIKENFSFGWFSSKDVKIAYQDEYGEDIKLSTVATYLSRLSSMGLLLKRGAGRLRHYRCIAPRRLL
ncbi:TPA: hypothetical protein EYP44_04015 [Candidatus Bathyarchaeota archaeon]|nr:hypothetical protein [Candidatus Bathyarchaeota archaeon]